MEFTHGVQAIACTGTAQPEKSDLAGSLKAELHTLDKRKGRQRVAPVRFSRVLSSRKEWVESILREAVRYWPEGSRNAAAARAGDRTTQGAVVVKPAAPGHGQRARYPGPIPGTATAYCYRGIGRVQQRVGLGATRKVHIDGSRIVECEVGGIRD